MSFLEWEGVERNPGPLGTVEVGPRERVHVKDKSPWKVLLCLFLSIALLATVYYFIFTSMKSVTVKAVGITFFVTILYLMLGYYVHPDPNMKNVGWLGGLINNPFRLSDNWNRFLIFLSLILRPARFVSESLVDFLVLLLPTHES